MLKTPVLRPITEMMASSMWFPLARLTYGAYLSHGIFMIFRSYNVEKGVFASEFDAAAKHVRRQAAKYSMISSSLAGFLRNSNISAIITLLTEEVSWNDILKFNTFPSSF
jgi:hypothetical protein